MNVIAKSFLFEMRSELTCRKNLIKMNFCTYTKAFPTYTERILEE